MKRLMICLFGSLIFGAASADAAVWTTKRAWTDQDEVRFGEFIRTLPLNYLDKGTHPFANIPTDCADAAYALRIVFSFQNGLPFEATLFDGKITNESARFDDVADEVQRVRKFIQLVRNGTNTRSLIEDSYPIAIRRGVVRPGTMFLHPQGSSKVPLTYRAGHVYYIQSVGQNGIIRYVSSTVPAAVRSLNARNGIVFAPMTEEGGYRAWKRPGAKAQANESLEQFRLGGWKANSYRDGSLWTRWQDAIVARLAVRAATPEEDLAAKRENLEGVVRERIKVVREGWAFYRKNYAAGQCMSARDYDAHSTPTRDVKVQIELQDFEAAANRFVDSRFNWSRASALRKVYAQSQFEVMPGLTIDVAQLKIAFLSDRVLAVSEPEHAPEVRWGLAEQGKWPCPDRRKAYHGHDTVRAE